MIAPEEKPATSRRKKRRNALRRRQLLCWILLAAVLPTILVSLYAVGAGEWRLGVLGIFVAFGLIYFASEASLERG